MTSPRQPATRRAVGDELPDPLAPGTSMTGSATTELPKGDVRVASWIALLGCIVVLVWYFSILISGGVYFGETGSMIAQFVVWAIALAAFICGLVSLNARRNREFAAVGFIAGIVSLLVNFAIGLPTGLQILY